MQTRRRFVLTAAALPLAATAARAQAPAADPLAKLLDAFMDEALADSPQLVTRLGFDKGERAAAKSQLDDNSLADLAGDRARTTDQLRRLKAIDRGALSGMAAVNYDSVLWTLAATDEANRRFEYGYEGASQPYVLTQLNGAYYGTPDFLGTQHAVETRADAEAYLSRLSAFAKVLDQEVERVRRDVGLGVVPPDFAIDKALTQLSGLVGAPAASPLVSSLATRAKEKAIAGDWAGRAGKIYQAEVVPALQRQIALMKGLKARAVHDAGCWRLPDGEAYYAHALRGGTTTRLTPDEVHQLGLDQAKSLGARADALLKGQGLTQGSVGERIQALFKDRRHWYANTDAAKEQLIADLNAQVKAMQARLPQMFKTLPKAPVEIRRVPKFIEAGAPGGYYNQPSLDGSRPGIYWINLRDSAEVPKWTLPTLTYHEAIPGHHMQLALQQEADLPTIRRATFLSAYGEGWALYAEELAKEMGVYENDPLGEIGYLQSALFRSARLVVDTGMHAKRWSREKAIAEMNAICGYPESVTVTEIERYAVWPGQACSYMVGKLTWMRLREKAKAALGPRFDIKAFHDAGLLSAAMPLEVLEGVIDRYIASARG